MWERITHDISYQTDLVAWSDTAQARQASSFSLVRWTQFSPLIGSNLESRLANGSGRDIREGRPWGKTNYYVSSLNISPPCPADNIHIMLSDGVGPWSWGKGKGLCILIWCDDPSWGDPAVMIWSSDLRIMNIIIVMRHNNTRTARGQLITLLSNTNIRSLLLFFMASTYN